PGPLSPRAQTVARRGPARQRPRGTVDGRRSVRQGRPDPDRGWIEGGRGVMPTSCDVLVIGAGVAGTSIACELAGQGVRVVLAERGAVCSGSSALNAGGVRQQFTHETTVQVATETVRRMTVFADEYGISPSFRQAGYLFLHGGGRHEATLRRAVATQNA